MANNGRGRLDLLVISVVSMLLFLHLADDVLELDWDPFNQELSSVLRTAGWMQALAQLASWLGGWLGYVAAFAVAVHFWRKKQHHELWCLGLALSGAVVLSWSLKHLMQVPRPYLNGFPVRPTWSFPSGHTLYGTCFYGYLAARLWGRHRPAALALWGLVFLVGWSRLGLGVHWVTDVMAGWLVGVAWIGFCLWAHHRLPAD